MAKGTDKLEDGLLDKTIDDLKSDKNHIVELIPPGKISSDLKKQILANVDKIRKKEIPDAVDLSSANEAALPAFKQANTNLTSVATALPFVAAHALTAASNVVGNLIANASSIPLANKALPESPVVIVINQDSKDVTPLLKTAPIAANLQMSSVQDNLDSLKSDEKEAVISEGLLLLVVVIAASLFGAHLCRKLRIRAIQMPILATIFGMLVGSVLRYGFNEHTILERILAFNDDVFFVLLLPPIIFESGFSLSGNKAQEFFNNFGTILCFAFVATLISFIFVGACIFFAGLVDLSMSFTVRESFAFGALISSTDPVSVLGIFKDLHANPIIYAIVSGESLLNDAISIVLYRIIADEKNHSIGSAILSFAVVFCASLTVGILIGLLSALIYRFMDLEKEENQILESALLLLFPWSSYLISDGFSQSGIVSILFCGMTMGKYTFPNLSEKAKQTSISMFGTLALLAETVVFVFLGIAVFSFPQKSATAGLFTSTLIFVSLGRIVSVFITSLIVNLFRNTKPITQNFQAALVACGLRGAIAFALALRARHDFGGVNGSAILSATLFYALFTILVVGFALAWIFEKLGIFQSDSERCLYSYIGPGDELAFNSSSVHQFGGNMRQHGSQELGYIKRAILNLDGRALRVLTNQKSSLDSSVQMGNPHLLCEDSSEINFGVIELQPQSVSIQKTFSEDSSLGWSSSSGNVSDLDLEEVYFKNDLSNLGEMRLRKISGTDELTSFEAGGVSEVDETEIAKQYKQRPTAVRIAFPPNLSSLNPQLNQELHSLVKPHSREPPLMLDAPLPTPYGRSEDTNSTDIRLL